MYVDQANATIGVDCHDAELIIRSDESTITAEGQCTDVIVSGEANTVDIADVSGDIRVYGNDNTITYSGDVAVRDVGQQNSITRR